VALFDVEMMRFLESLACTGAVSVLPRKELRVYCGFSRLREIYINNVLGVENDSIQKSQ
jgi:hypothetical protein